MGMDAVFVLGRRHSSAEMRQRFQRRTRVLDQIRSQIYLSGTYVRDYLLAPEAFASSAQCGRLQKLNLHSAPELILYAVRKGIIS